MGNDISWQLKLYRDVQLIAARTIYPSTCHFLKIDDRDNPKPHASGVFAKIENNYFLLTAAHVIDDCEENIYIGIKQEEPLLRLGGEWTKNIPETTREKDKIDAAVLKLDDETIKKIGGAYQFIDINSIEINHSAKEMPMYLSLGFPATMSKFNSYKNKMVSKPFQYITMCAKEEVYAKLECDTIINIVVYYDKNNVVDYSSGEKKNGPDPFGISGSGLWYVPETEVLKTSGVNKKLVAIMTEWPSENRNYWIGTRIDVFTEIIRNKYNINIPKSSIVNVKFE